MKIKPFGNKIQLHIDESSAGALTIVSLPTAIERGKVTAVGDEVKGVKVGDTVMYKSWAVDIVTVDGERYFFLDLSTNGLCGIIK